MTFRGQKTGNRKPCQCALVWENTGPGMQARELLIKSQSQRYPDSSASCFQFNFLFPSDLQSNDDEFSSPPPKRPQNRVLTLEGRCVRFINWLLPSSGMTGQAHILHKLEYGHSELEGIQIPVVYSHNLILTYVSSGDNCMTGLLYISLNLSYIWVKYNNKYNPSDQKHFNCVMSYATSSMVLQKCHINKNWKPPSKSPHRFFFHSTQYL